MFFAQTKRGNRQYDKIEDNSVIQCFISTTNNTNRVVSLSTDCKGNLTYFSMKLSFFASGIPLHSGVLPCHVQSSSIYIQHSHCNVRSPSLLALRNSVRRVATYHNCTTECQVGTTGRKVRHQGSLSTGARFLF